MAIIANDTQFIGIAPSIDLNGKKSALLNAQTEPVTMQDIIDTVGPGSQGPQGIQGPVGPQGVPGPVGPAGLEWQGSWVSGTSYVADDAVGFGGASYFCILATSGTTAPNLDTTHWALLASQGAIGPAGATGAQGPTGPQGPTGILPSFVEYNATNATIWNNGWGDFPSNTSFGEFALSVNDSGQNNTAYGTDSLRFNFDGSQNTAIGKSALRANTTGNNNTAVGYNSLPVSTTSGGNVALGSFSLYSNETGNQNTAIGASTLVENVVGEGNVAIGTAALSYATSNSNTAVGTEAGQLISSGQGNSLLGAYSGSALETGTGNVVIGRNSNVYSSGTNFSISIGEGAKSESYSVAIGSLASSGGYSYCVSLGTGATATANNQFVVGSTAQNVGIVDTAAVTPTKRWKVKINGVDYYIPLQTV
jgi:hypothetical protein